MTEISIENTQKKILITDELRATLEKTVNAVLEYEECDFEAEVSITITDNDEIAELNELHRGKAAPTDVLSFPINEFDEEGRILAEEGDYDDEGRIILGDIVISADRALEQAEEYGHSFTREMAFLTVHSMLHLLGYDHVDDPEGERLMIHKQKEILSRLGITRE